ncbi:MAG TPA: phosphoribosylglycinamide formyltransferase [Flavobacteriaceae bacterium]|nr:phosphoribosylglycinamide formyltransferase [Flavobacteriaceae bacterium]
MKKRIVVFASGTGSNTINIINYFNEHPNISVSCVMSNNKAAPVLQSATELGVANYSFDKDMLQNENGKVLQILQEIKPDLIVLAGFLWKFPVHIIKEFPNVINIHPALLPKYGGRGMYGANVHRAVLDNKEIESGITIHKVNEIYDDGTILFQKRVAIDPEETIETLQQKIHSLEHKYFPEVIEKLLLSKNL